MIEKPAKSAGIGQSGAEAKGFRAALQVFVVVLAFLLQATVISVNTGHAMAAPVAPELAALSAAIGVDVTPCSDHSPGGGDPGGPHCPDNDCPLCQLAFHFDLLTPAPAVAVVAQWPVRRRETAPVRALFIGHRPLDSAQPRAPPAFA